ncbi:MAG: GNAT family N-acetyltransferase [Alphaproteobacteria bacterium]|jgi:GNAT superfamily N-acetyltransferase|nr:GNAT family N-acetyltransferase [Alphaproteobacteria bacterium]
MTIRIRRAGPEDADAIAALAHGLNEHEGEPTEHFTAEAVRRDGFGDDPAFGVLLAEVGDRPAGYALFHDSYDTGHAARGRYLCDLFVSPEARRLGVGRALVGATAREAAAEGRVYLWWTAYARNLRARAFYDAIGAREEHLVVHALSGKAFDRLVQEAPPSTT